MASEYPHSISVIIVNYNVEFFLEQCLNSVKKALQNTDGEVFVVDNNSIDGSVEMVKSKFPDVSLIENKKNVGFSTANNQAIKLSKGEFVLLLNPDTVIEEDTLSKVVNFMKSNPKSGGLGVRMVDGKGQFLPESKRGLPTPTIAFYKIFGLSKLFPKSKKFGQYHLGHLSEFEINEVDILSGAFMLMRKKALDKVGLLDETFFMYGEDVDLSYRIQKGGYKNFYFPETRIIHYKGESTKKSSINYVFVFYRAMVIFAEKHFSSKNAKLFSNLINSAIYLRAFIAIINRFIKKMILPIIDALSIIILLYFTTLIWENSSIIFPMNILKFALPSYTLTWLISNFYSGSYDKPISINRFIKGNTIGTIIILIIYALLPKDWQFSRLFILVGTLVSLSYFILSRITLHFLFKEYSLNISTNKNFAIVGSEDEIKRVTEIIKVTSKNTPKIFAVNIENKGIHSIGTISQLDQITYIHEIDEVIFCAKDTSAYEIIKWMTTLNSDKIDFKIAQPDSLFLIGSNSIDTAGDLYVLNINSITNKSNIRSKRTFDVIVSSLLLITSPINIWFFKQKKKYLSNLTFVFLSKKSLIGYHNLDKKSENKLPKIKEGILSNNDIEKNIPSHFDKLNLIYARDYKVTTDLNILYKAWKKLDR
ncbi:glycosyltransferase family 2 protein [Crocinitomicaceae bacterium]|nr:glycosyltransferase family 2 protein [Crocinitomicaceae bacterium]